jgi:hypothetical protein
MTRSGAVNGAVHPPAPRSADDAEAADTAPRKRGRQSKQQLKQTLRRISLYLTKTVENDLEQLVSETGGTEAEVVRQGITLRKWAHEVSRRGAEIYVEDPVSGKREALKLLW